jgi:hypothetical protein
MLAHWPISRRRGSFQKSEVKIIFRPRDIKKSSRQGNLVVQKKPIYLEDFFIILNKEGRKERVAFARDIIG